MNSLTSYVVNIDTASKEHWDCVVIGAGMGGGATAYESALKGKKTLLIDLGNIVDASSGSKSIVEEVTDAKERKQRGLWPHKVRTEIDGEQSDIWAPMGSGIGGSTLLYAAALQRLERDDLSPHTLPSGERVKWPFSYEELDKFYAKAERLLQVRGTADPRHEDPCDLLPPPKMSEADEEFFQSFKRSGFNPYRLHVGISYKEGCGECAGELCARSCKRDALNSFIEPALSSGNLFLLPNGEVENILAESGVVRSITLSSGARIVGNKFFLAAGALSTPKILLSSKNSDGQPLAAHLKHLGRNLMFHAGHHIAFWPSKNSSRVGPTKTIALRDFYTHNGMKMGEFQSTGLTAGYGNILYAARFLISQTKLRHIPLLSKFMVIPAYLLSKVLGNASIFATIVEDFPYYENRVELDKDSPSGYKIVYKIHEELSHRTYLMSRLVREKLKPIKSVPVNFKMHLNYGHPCGTCRASDSAETGVLDENCRVFGVKNLYVTDASFMPTCGGTNPSLTIAANALRVANNVLAGIDN